MWPSRPPWPISPRGRAAATGGLARPSGGTPRSIPPPHPRERAVGGLLPRRPRPRGRGRPQVRLCGREGQGRSRPHPRRRTGCAPCAPPSAPTAISASMRTAPGARTRRSLPSPRTPHTTSRSASSPSPRPRRPSAPRPRSRSQPHPHRRRRILRFPRRPPPTARRGRRRCSHHQALRTGLGAALTMIAEATRPRSALHPHHDVRYGRWDGPRPPPRRAPARAPLCLRPRHPPPPCGRHRAWLPHPRGGSRAPCGRLRSGCHPRRCIPRSVRHRSLEGVPA